MQEKSDGRTLILKCDNRGGSTPRRDMASRERGLQVRAAGCSHGEDLDRIAVDRLTSYTYPSHSQIYPQSATFSAQVWREGLRARHPVFSTLRDPTGDVEFVRGLH